MHPEVVLCLYLLKKKQCATLEMFLHNLTKHTNEIPYISFFIF